MKKIIPSLALITSAFAQENPTNLSSPSPVFKNHADMESPTQTSDLYWDYPEGTTLEARLSCYIFQSALLRNVYNYCAPNYELEGTVPVWKPLQFWWALSYLYRSGNSEGLSNSTTIQIFPITVGLKALFRTPWCQPYAGMGMKYFFVWTHNDAPYVISSISKNGMGGVAEIGALFEPLDHFIIDIFATYSYKEFHTHFSSPPNLGGQSLNVGGWNLGAGLGYQF